MNYLHSAVVLASFASLVALVAGCNEGSDVTEDVTPSVDVGSKGLEPQASGTSVCVQDYGGTDKDAAFLQVQASRVSKYLFGGNDPFDTSVDAYGNVVGASKEFGPWGMKQPDLGNAECQKGADLIHKLHDKLYPPPAEKCDAKVMVRTRDGLVCPSPAATAAVTSGALSVACNLPADTFGFSVSTADQDWVAMKNIAPLLDGCWGKGLSGFWWTKEGVIGPDEKNRVNILGTDPEPADLTAPLTGSTGATAAAIYVNTGTPTNVLLWPQTLTAGGSATAGTPCSPYGLGPGDRTSRQIVVMGSLRKCI